MSTLAEKIAALPPIDLSSIVFEDEEDEICVHSPAVTSSCPTSAGDALAAIDISADFSDYDEEEYYFAPSSSSSSSSSSCKSPPLPTFPTSSLSVPPSLSVPQSLSVPSSSDSSSFASPPTSTKKLHKQLEPTNSSTNFWWPEGICPEYLPGPLQPEAAQPCYSEITIISGPQEQVVPFISRKLQWAPSKPSPLRVVWTMEEEEEEELPSSSTPLETEVGNDVEIFEEEVEVEPLNRLYLSLQMLRLASS